MTSVIVSLVYRALIAGLRFSPQSDLHVKLPPYYSHNVQVHVYLFTVLDCSIAP